MNIYFHSFAILIGLRDVWSGIILSKNLHPLTMLFYFSLFTSLFSLIISKLQKKDKVLKSFIEHSKLYLSLGIFTTLAFSGMMYGISLIGASLFTVIEHGLIPFFTFFMGIRLLGERVDRNHWAGIICAIIGVQLIFVPGLKTETNQIEIMYLVGIILAILGSVLTAYTSVIQKKLVSCGQDSFVILFWRFLIPSVILFMANRIYGLPHHIEYSGEISVLALVGFTIPLYLLLKGFVKSTMISFSMFNLMIPLYTIFIAIIIHPKDLDKMLNAYSITGSLLVMLGFVISENFFNLFKLIGKENE